MELRMILAVFFFVFNIIALISQFSRYQKLGRDASLAQDAEEIAAFKKAQTRMIPNMIILVIGIALLLYLFFLFLSAP